MSDLLIAITAILVFWLIHLILQPRENQTQSHSDAPSSQLPESNRRFALPTVQKPKNRREGAASANSHSPNPAAPATGRQTRVDRQAELHARGGLKVACLALLDTVAIEHPAGHTGSVARYLLRSNDDDRIELMFEKGPKSRANLWLTRALVGDLLSAGIEFRLYPASDLYKPTEAGGEPSYGRHTALKKMRDLANADLVRFTIYRVEEVQKILREVVADDLRHPSSPDSRSAEMARGAPPDRG